MFTNSSPEHAKDLIQYPTPLWMIDYEAKGAGNYPTFYVDHRNVVLLLEHYLPNTHVDSEVIQVTDDEVSHVKVTMTVMHPHDGTIVKRVSAISGQRNQNKSGRDVFAEAKAGTFAYKRAAEMLGICADIGILLSNKTVKQNVQNGTYKRQVDSEVGGSEAPTADKPEIESKQLLSMESRPELMERLIELSEKTGMGEQKLRRTILSREGVPLNELNKNRLCHYVDLSLTKLASM